ncbi:MAG: sulfate adenylyltransferase subunit CysN [Acidobacteriaceae bacterium]|nr:sulfate adenylyltransferase subunit CysN [Acidobacteriaceae bacterium]
MSAATVLNAAEPVEAFLEQEKEKGLLRFTTAGSVDDGKSTLIGRLLYDSRSVYEDQLESVTKASVGRNAGAIDFSLLTDGLRAEREQGITIDVAYRYFATPRRKFIIADTPGHEQYTRNMVTGASTADLAIILVDARKGLLPQSRRHAYISSLLGLSQLVIAVNKMDLVDYDSRVFHAIEQDFRHFLGRFHSIDSYFVPISALRGDNVVTRSSNMRWFAGPSLLEYLETVPVGNRARTASFRFPVQRVVRPDQEFRGYAGTVVSGAVSKGEEVIVLPSGRQTRIVGIHTFDGDLETAQAGQAITLTLEEEIDISRGDMLALPDDLPHVADSIKATLVWLSEKPANLGGRYRLKHTTRQQWASIRRIDHRININTLDHESADALAMNEIGVVDIESARALMFDSYSTNRATGSFILIDEATNATVAAGLIAGAVSFESAAFDYPADVAWQMDAGKLILSLGGGADALGNPREPQTIHDPETLKALDSLLRRLGIAWKPNRKD